MRCLAPRHKTNEQILGIIQRFVDKQTDKHGAFANVVNIVGEGQDCATHRVLVINCTTKKAKSRELVVPNYSCEEIAEAICKHLTGETFWGKQ